MCGLVRHIEFTFAFCAAGSTFSSSAAIRCASRLLRRFLGRFARSFLNSLVLCSGQGGSLLSKQHIVCTLRSFSALRGGGSGEALAKKGDC
jgi:hypothetical protein